MMSRTAGAVVAASRKNCQAKNKKHVWMVRHGQALHNPRAEAAREAGCSRDEFLELMRQDDELDADLTELGESQATQVGTDFAADHVDLVVSSPLSRAMRTADLVAPEHAINGVKRMAVEHFREVNGWLLNAKRRSKAELLDKFPAWDFSELHAWNDELWTETLETHEDCAKRGYAGLDWLLRRQEERILLVSHGGILRFTMNLHDHVDVVDARTAGTNGRKDVKAKFGNCEVRRYELSWQEDEHYDGSLPRTIRLAEIDF